VNPSVGSTAWQRNRVGSDHAVRPSGRHFVGSSPPLPARPPAGCSELNQLFGDHTFFLDKNGLNVVEPNENNEVDASAGTVTNLANWGDAQLTI
jgi:hypothetical protein